MKRLSLTIICFLSAAGLYAQDENPFAKHGYQVKVVTMTNGRFPESHDRQKVVQIGSVYFDTKDKTITGDVEMDTTVLWLEPQTISRWMCPDPMAEKYYHISPYAFCANNPIIYIDPNGMEYTDYYNLNGKKLHIDDGKDDIRLVLTTSNKDKDIRANIKDGNVVDVPSFNVVSTMEKVFDKTESTGSEHYFRVGNNGTISRVVKGETGKVGSDAIMSTTKDLTDAGDLVAYDVHSHTPPKKDGTTTTFGKAIASDTDKNNIVGSKPNVVLGYRGFEIPPPPGQIGGTSTVGTARQIGFFNSKGQIGQPVDFSQFKRVITRINK